MIYIPIYFKTVYSLDSASGYYLCTSCPPDFNGTPGELLITQQQNVSRQVSSDLIIRERSKTLPTDSASDTEQPKRFSLFAGLLPTQFVDLYDGSILANRYSVKRRKDYLNARLFPSDGYLILLYFPGWHPYPNDRSPLHSGGCTSWFILTQLNSSESTAPNRRVCSHSHRFVRGVEPGNRPLFLCFAESKYSI